MLPIFLLLVAVGSSGLRVPIDQNHSGIKSENKTHSSSCRPLHVRAPSLNMVCCDRTGGLSPDCQYRRLCGSERCSCTLTVMSGFSCKYQSAIKHPINWENHKPPAHDPLPCPHLNFPNPTADYSVTIQKWSQNFSMLLLTSLSKHNVLSLDIDLGAPLDAINLANLDELLPNVERLIIRASPVQRGLLIDGDFLGRFSKLRFLKMNNVDFKFPETKAEWTSTIEKLQIESSSLRSFPRWMSACSRLTNLLLRNTHVDSVMTISRMPSLVFVYADANRLNDLSKVSFSSPLIEVLDLSNNRIENFSTHTFSQLKVLRFLDLSKNVITSFPLRGFQANGLLKYLHLEDLRLESVGPEHLAGLHTLKLLSLSRNPLKSLDPFAFMPIRVVRTLEIDDCNFTAIPLAVTQCCSLTSLSMSGNLFYQRDSLPVEILALISHVDNFNFGRNPLVQLPYGLFLLDRAKPQLMRNLVDTLIELPLWNLEPCTSYLWHIHLKESPPDVRKRVASWNENRMKLENLTHCQQLYESVISSLIMYRGLKQHSGCEMTRKYRSIRPSCKTGQLPNSSVQRVLGNFPHTRNCTSNKNRAADGLRIDHVTRLITLGSLGLNLLFLALVVVRLLTSGPSAKRDHSAGFVRNENKRDPSVQPADHEETRRAFLQAFEMSRR